MYNQPTIRMPDGTMKGTLYKNPIDCLWKTFKTEGVRGWYKGELKPLSLVPDLSTTKTTGSTAHFLRIAPHT